MKKAILIGGSGFLGSRVLDLLLKEGIEVLATVNQRQLADHPKLQHLEGGINALGSDVIDAFHPDTIFHCARPTMPRLKRFGRTVAARMAAGYNKKLLAAIHGAKHTPRLVFASGSLMYGNNPDAVDEAAPLKLLSYAREYYFGERPLVDAAEEKTEDVVILRFPWLLGPGSWFRWFYQDPAAQQGLVPVFGKGDTMMHILDIRDAAALLIRYATGADEAGVYNIPGGTIIPQLGFAERYARLKGIKTIHHKVLYPRLERAALEAFTSNILLTTRYPGIMGDYDFIPLDQSLADSEAV